MLMDALESWGQWLEIKAYYGINPGGELRRDIRQSVLIHYMLSPYMESGTDIPDLTYPYYNSNTTSYGDITKAREAVRARDEQIRQELNDLGLV